jgi:hypothetical protein
MKAEREEAAPRGGYFPSREVWTRWSSGEITFSLHAISGNPSVMPGALVEAHGSSHSPAPIRDAMLDPAIGEAMRRSPDCRTN